jgi:hypothetical protein
MYPQHTAPHRKKVSRMSNSGIRWRGRGGSGTANPYSYYQKSKKNSGSLIPIKEFKYFNPKIASKLSEI